MADNVEPIRPDGGQLSESPSAGGGAGGDHGERLVRLETHFEYIRNDLKEIKADQKSILEKLTSIPTRSDLWQWKITWTGIAVAAIALIVGGIIGGLSWIKAETQPPTVIYSPPPSQVAPDTSTASPSRPE